MRMVQTILCAVLLFCLRPAVAAVTVTVESQGGDRYLLTYTVTNETTLALAELAIYFDHTRYFALALEGAPPDWDPILIQPEPVLSSDGIVDILAIGAPLGPGATLTGLSISASFAGPGAPGPQRFEFLDPQTFAVLATGQTQVAAPPRTVDSPSTVPLAAVGLLALLAARAKTPGGRHARA